jgi:hypothetical protein
MKSSIRRNYLFGAVGGLGTVLLFLGASTNAAHAFTDSTGATCTAAFVVTTNVGQFCSGGDSTPSTIVPFVPTKAGPFHLQPRSFGDGNQVFDFGFGGPVTAPEPESGPFNGPVGLGMYVSPNGGMSGDVTLGGGGYSLRNSGASVSDTAGLIAPGTNSPSYHENGGGGGLSGTYDASRFVGPNQHLWFNGAFNYTNSSTNFGGAGAGSSINGENYGFTGTALYSNYNTYLQLTGS